MRAYVLCKKCGEKIIVRTDKKNKSELYRCFTLKGHSDKCWLPQSYTNHDVWAEVEPHLTAGCIITFVLLFGVIFGPIGALSGGFIGGAIGSAQTMRDERAADEFNRWKG